MRASEFLRALANGRIRLEVDIAERRRDWIDEFRNEYRARTGEMPGEGFTKQARKWGRQFRIYCNVDGFVIEALRAAGVNVTTNQVYRRIYNDRFTDEELSGT